MACLVLPAKQLSIETKTEAWPSPGPGLPKAVKSGANGIILQVVRKKGEKEERKLPQPELKMYLEGGV